MSIYFPGTQLLIMYKETISANYIKLKASLWERKTPRILYLRDPFHLVDTQKMEGHARLPHEISLTQLHYRNVMQDNVCLD